MMRVMIYIPLAPQTPRIYARTLSSVLTLQWPHPVELVLGREDNVNGMHKYQNLTLKYNRARQMALDGGYDALMTVESDMILPPLALERMSRIDADVIYGLYVSRHGKRKWLAFDHIDASGYGASLSDVPEEAARSWGLVRKTAGVGMGCTFIRRPVLEALEFRCPETKYANDWYFSLDCTEHGFVQKHDLGIVCGHIQGAPDPKILWPEQNGGYSVEFFDDDNRDRVKLDGYQVDITRLGTLELYPPPMEAA